jgi:hypothetical protein
VRFAHEGVEILIEKRLAARQVKLQDAERRGFAKNTPPRRGVELELARYESFGVRAIHASQGTAMREFREKGERRRGHEGKCVSQPTCQPTDTHAVVKGRSIRYLGADD